MQNILISQVVPLPWDSTNQSVEEYQKVYKKAFPSKEYSFISLEGFLSAKLTVMAMSKSTKNITRENFINSFISLKHSALKDLKISFSKYDHQALDNVYITEYKEDKFKQIKSSEKDYE